ncbi:MAG: pitrilysin family protein, partial [Neisseria sp.]|nr:pitrilysin family protein [Neisseria sp.]
MKKQLFAVLLSLACLQTASAIEIQRWQTPAGSTITLAERHQLPIVHIQVSFKGAGDSANAPQDVAQMSADLLSLGTKKLGEEALLEQSTQLGISISSRADSENAHITLSTLNRPEIFHQSLNLLEQVITSPRFAKHVLQREIAQNITALKQQETSPNFLAQRALNQLNYGTHPYARASQTSAQTLNAVNTAQLRDFHRRHYAQNNAYIAIVGDVTREQANAISQQLLRKLPAKTPAQQVVPAVQVQQGKQQQIELKGKSQTIVQIGVPLLKSNDPDRYALIVGNYILGGGGFDSRLMQKLRDEHGLVYGVSSSLSRRSQAAPFVIAFATQKERTQQALAATRQVLQDFIAHGPSETELKQAKDKIIGSHPLNLDTNAKLLPLLASVGLENLELDYLARYPEKIQEVSVNDIRDAWQRRLKLDELNT